MESVDCRKQSNSAHRLQKQEKQRLYAGAEVTKKPKSNTFVQHDDVFFMKYVECQKQSNSAHQESYI